MLENSGATSERFVSAGTELGDEESYSSRCEYAPNELSISKRAPSADSPLEEDEINSSSQSSRKIILLDIWSVNDFLVSMTKDVYGRLCLAFRFPTITL